MPWRARCNLEVAPKLTTRDQYIFTHDIAFKVAQFCEKTTNMSTLVMLWMFGQDVSFQFVRFE
jgi:hypothetical protein